MKKTIAAMAILGVCVSAPALANHERYHTTETRTYRTVQTRPMTVEQRRALQTKIERHVKKLDLNEDRKVDMDEFVSCKTQKGKDLNTSIRMFKNTDTNNDGFVSSQEIMDAKMRYMSKHSMSSMELSSDDGDAYYRQRMMNKNR